MHRFDIATRFSKLEAAAYRPRFSKSYFLVPATDPVIFQEDISVHKCPAVLNIYCVQSYEFNKQQSVAITGCFFFAYF